ncbi:MAG TPA: AlpA family phage regulatory protein [Trinickia sp.]|uniref:helix-turn-helix transcriptional regulator n=1 Tax=Trinickia sp. TaxID=2571163 RepID=UPI002F4233A6
MACPSSWSSADRQQSTQHSIDSISTTVNFCSDRLIDIKELILLTGDSRTSAYEKMNQKSDAYDPDHPVGVRLGRKSVRYRLSEVLAYIASRPRVRDIGDPEGK